MAPDKAYENSRDELSNAIRERSGKLKFPEETVPSAVIIFRNQGRNIAKDIFGEVTDATHLQVPTDVKLGLPYVMANGALRLATVADIYSYTDHHRDAPDNYKICQYQVYRNSKWNGALAAKIDDRPRNLDRNSLETQRIAQSDDIGEYVGRRVEIPNTTTVFFQPWFRADVWAKVKFGLSSADGSPALTIRGLKGIEHDGSIGEIYVFSNAQLEKALAQIGAKSPAAAENLRKQIPEELLEEIKAIWQMKDTIDRSAEAQRMADAEAYKEAVKSTKRSAWKKYKAGMTELKASRGSDNGVLTESIVIIDGKEITVNNFDPYKPALGQTLNQYWLKAGMKPELLEASHLALIYHSDRYFIDCLNKFENAGIDLKGLDTLFDKHESMETLTDYDRQKEAKIVWGFRHTPQTETVTMEGGLSGQAVFSRYLMVNVETESRYSIRDKSHKEYKEISYYVRNFLLRQSIGIKQDLRNHLPKSISQRLTEKTLPAILKKYAHDKDIFTVYESSFFHEGRAVNGEQAPGVENWQEVLERVAAFTPEQRMRLLQTKPDDLPQNELVERIVLREWVNHARAEIAELMEKYPVSKFGKIEADHSISWFGLPVERSGRDLQIADGISDYSLALWLDNHQDVLNKYEINTSEMPYTIPVDLPKGYYSSDSLISDLAKKIPGLEVPRGYYSSGFIHVGDKKFSVKLALLPDFSGLEMTIDGLDISFKPEEILSLIKRYHIVPLDQAIKQLPQKLGKRLDELHLPQSVVKKKFDQFETMPFEFDEELAHKYEAVSAEVVMVAEASAETEPTLTAKDQLTIDIIRTFPKIAGLQWEFRHPIEDPESEVERYLNNGAYDFRTYGTGGFGAPNTYVAYISDEDGNRLDVAEVTIGGRGKYYLFVPNARGEGIEESSFINIPDTYTPGSIQWEAKNVE